MSIATTRSFEFLYKVSLARGQMPARVWIPLASTDAFQDVIEHSFELANSIRGQVSVHEQNKVLYLLLQTSDVEQSISLRFKITRRARTSAPPSSDGYGVSLETLGLAPFMTGNARVPVDGSLGEEARDVVARCTSPLEKARAIFDHVLATYSYDCSGCTPAKGESLGDLTVACDLKLGTCTELHGLLVAYLRGAGVPARFAFGFNIPGRPHGLIGGYHCWSEAYLPGSGWFPIDVSEARKRPAGAERDFYFGNLDQNRVQFSTGRDLTLVPAQFSGPLDKLIFPLVEQNDSVITPQLEFSFSDLQPSLHREYAAAAAIAT